MERLKADLDKLKTIQEENSDISKKEKEELKKIREEEIKKV